MRRTQQRKKKWNVLQQAPFVVLVLMAFLLPLLYSPLTRDPLTPVKTLFFVFGSLFALLLWGIRTYTEKTLTLRKSILDVPFMLFAGAALLSTIFSIAPSVSFLGQMAHAVLSLQLIWASVLFTWLVIQETQTAARFQIFLQALLLGLFLSGLIFLFGDTLLLRELALMLGLDVIALNSISSLNSVFGVVMTLMVMLSTGMLLKKDTGILAGFVPTATLVTGVACLFRGGFSFVWALAALGFALIAFLGWAMSKHIRKWALLGVSIALVLSLLFIFFGSPAALRTTLPTEVTLGVVPSWQIVYQTLLDGPKQFLLGMGPGTFSYAYAAYHPPIADQALLGAVRFDHPFNTFFALLSEFGLLGTVAWFVTALMLVGALITSMKDATDLVFDDVVAALKAQAGKPHTHTHTIHRDGLMIGAAWMLATVALFFVYADITLWWLWWTITGLLLVGLHRSTPRLIHKKTWPFHLSHQGSLIAAFGMVLVITLVVIAAAYSFRFVLAERAFTNTVKTGSREAAALSLSRALQLRAGYPEYHLTEARILLQEASERAASGQEAEVVTRLLAEAVNAARTAVDTDPQNVKTWDTLATMYANTRSFAPEANAWTKEALEKAIELEPANAMLYARLGIASEIAGESAAAQEAYVRAILLRPTYASAYQQLAGLYEAEGNLEAARSVYAEAAVALPEHIEIHYHLARLLFNTEDEQNISEAEKIWLSIVGKAPGHSNTLYSLGLLYEKQGRRLDALKYYRRVQKINPNNRDIVEKIENL